VSECVSAGMATGDTNSATIIRPKGMVDSRRHSVPAAARTTTCRTDGVCVCVCACVCVCVCSVCVCVCLSLVLIDRNIRICVMIHYTLSYLRVSASKLTYTHKSVCVCIFGACV